MMVTKFIESVIASEDHILKPSRLELLYSSTTENNGHLLQIELAKASYVYMRYVYYLCVEK